MMHRTSPSRTAKHLALPPFHPSTLSILRRRYRNHFLQKSFFTEIIFFSAVFFSMKFFFYYLKIFFCNDYYGKIALISPPPSHKTSHTTPHCTQDFVTADYAKEKGLTMKNLSGTKFRQMLRAGDDIPTW
jgi:hypothetical protein